MAKQGRDELLGVIAETMTAIEAGSGQASVSAEGLPVPSGKAKETRKKRPDRARPW
jgi:hypothetical protein